MKSQSSKETHMEGNTSNNLDQITVEDQAGLKIPDVPEEEISRVAETTEKIVESTDAPTTTCVTDKGGEIQDEGCQNEMQKDEDGGASESKDAEALASPSETNEDVSAIVNGSSPEELEDTIEKHIEEAPKQDAEEKVVEVKAAAAGDSSSKKSSQKEVKQPSKSKSKESGKNKDGKSKKKEDKSIEHVLRALSCLQTPEEKLAALCKKYTELFDEQKVLQASSKQSTRQISVLLREKEQLQLEHSRALFAKSKMESLCRELQKHNRLVKEESLVRVREEEEKRKEVANRFQTTITDIQNQMQDNYSKNTKLREENIELATRLKDLVANYENAQAQVENVFKQNLLLSQEKEKDCKEKQLLFMELEQSNKKIQLLEATEAQLREQLTLYTERYEEFQATLQKSNDVYRTFKTEMDKMTKKIKKLEKETVTWKSRWESSNTALLEMAEAKTTGDQEMSKMQTKIQKLEKLCRALQAERNSMKSDSEKASSRETSPSEVVKDQNSSSQQEGDGDAPSRNRDAGKKDDKVSKVLEKENGGNCAPSAGGKNTQEDEQNKTTCGESDETKRRTNNDAENVTEPNFGKDDKTIPPEGTTSQECQITPVAETHNGPDIRDGAGSPRENLSGVSHEDGKAPPDHVVSNADVKSEVCMKDENSHAADTGLDGEVTKSDACTASHPVHVADASNGDQEFDTTEDPAS